MPTEQVTKRNGHLDAIKGSLILLVVFAHLIAQFAESGFINKIYVFIYTFHMPAFIFISGLLTGKTLETNKIARNIIIPLLIFNFIYEAVYFAENGAVSGYLQVGAPYWIMWFMLSLASWRLLTPLIKSLKHPVIISLVISISAQFLDISGHTLSILRTLSFLPFYVIGMVVADRSFAFDNLRKLTLFGITIVSITLLLSIGLFSPIKLFYGAIPFSALGVPVAEFITIKLINFVAVPALVLAVMSFKFYSSLLARFGKGSLSIYVLHGLLIPYISTAMVNYNAHGCNLFIAALISISLCFVLSARSVSSFLDGIYNAAYKLLFK